MKKKHLNKLIVWITTGLMIVSSVTPVMAEELITEDIIRDAPANDSCDFLGTLEQEENALIEEQQISNGICESNIDNSINLEGSYKDICGTWEGTFVGTNEYYELISRTIKIEIDKLVDGKIEGVATIDGGEGGSYYFDGVYDIEGGNIRFQGVEWIKNPKNFFMAPFSGTINEDKNTIIGVSNNDENRPFSIEKISESFNTKRINLDEIPKEWTGEYDGFCNGVVVRRDYNIQIQDIDNKGKIKGIATISPSSKDNTGYAENGSYYYKGTIDERKGEIKLQGYEWIQYPVMVNPDLKDNQNHTFFHFNGVIDLSILSISGTSDHGIWEMKAVDDDKRNNISFTYQGHRYQIVDKGLTWTEAKQECEKKGGHLMTILSQGEQDVLTEKLENANRNSYWIGGYLDGNKWRWITEEKWDYEHWAYNQPDDGGGSGFKGEDSLMVYKKRNPRNINQIGEWNDLKGDGTCGDETFFGLNNFGYICEWDDNSSESNKYRVTYKPNGWNGIMPKDEKEYEAGTIVGIKYDDVPERKGYIFAGWCDNENGEGRFYSKYKQNDSSFVIYHDTTLYAVWINCSKAKELKVNELCKEEAGSESIYWFTISEKGNYTINFDINDGEYTDEYDSTPYEVTLLNENGNLASISAVPITKLYKNKPAFENIELNAGKYYLYVDDGSNKYNCIKGEYDVYVRQVWLADFVLGRDNCGFSNSNGRYDERRGFGRRDYDDLEKQYKDDRLFKIADGVEKNNIIAFINESVEKRKKYKYGFDGWCGECYGMCFSMESLYRKKLSISDISSDIKDNYYSVKAPLDNHKLDQNILLYELTAFVQDGSRMFETSEQADASYLYINNNKERRVEYKYTLDDFLRKLINYSKEERMGCLSYGMNIPKVDDKGNQELDINGDPVYETIAHAVLITGCEYDVTLSQNKIRLYDPNSVDDKFRYMYIQEKNDNTFTFRTDLGRDVSSDNYTYLQVNKTVNSDVLLDNPRDTSPSIYNAKIEEWNFNFPYDSVGFHVKTTDDKFDFYYDPQNHIVVDEDGKPLTENVVDVRTIGCYGDGQSYLEYTLSGFEEGDTINIIPQGKGDLDISVYNLNGYAKVVGDNIESIDVNLDKGVVLHGSDYNFRSYVDCGNNSSDTLVSVAGDASSNVIIEQIGNEVTATSDENIKNVTTKKFIDGEVEEENPEDSKEVVVVTENKQTIVSGQKINLKETCFSNVTDTISRYVVDNNKLASVSKQMLSGKKPGTVKVTAQKQIGKKEYQDVGECTVTILNRPNLKFTVPMTYKGQTINAADHFQTADTKTIGAAYWESSKPGVVEVTDAKAGTLKAVGSGSAKITAYFGEKGKPGTLKVSASLAVKIPSFQKNEYMMLTGGKLTLAMKNVTVAMNPEWVILDTDIATEAPQVNNKGVPTGKVTVSAFRAGDAKLKAVIDGQEYFCDVHVAAPVINKKAMTLKVNKTATVSLKNTKLDKFCIEWYSTDPAVASVSTDGKIKALSPGTATIYTETGGVRNECVVTVK